MRQSSHRMPHGGMLLMNMSVTSRIHTTSRLLSPNGQVEMHITACKITIQCTPTFHHLCYKSHVIGGEPQRLYSHFIRTKSTLLNTLSWVLVFPSAKLFYVNFWYFERVHYSTACIKLLEYSNITKYTDNYCWSNWLSDGNSEYKIIYDV